MSNMVSKGNPKIDDSHLLPGKGRYARHVGCGDPSLRAFLQNLGIAERDVVPIVVDERDDRRSINAGWSRVRGISVQDLLLLVR